MDFRSKKLTILRRSVRKASVIGFSAVALSTFAISAQATTSFSNGSLESTTAGGHGGIVDGGGQVSYNINVTDWTTTGYNFLFASGTADNETGTNGSDGAIQLWGPGNGSSNGLPASSPDGGNYVAADGAYEVAPISQQISGLTPGADYTVGFDWAGAQQLNFTGATTEQWTVNLGDTDTFVANGGDTGGSFTGGQTQSTAVLDNLNHGFTGWVNQTFTFQADATSEWLSFLAVGTPTGEPPFVLLDGVSFDGTVPEPGTWILTLGALGLACGLGVVRSKKWFKRELRAGADQAGADQ
jgi:hypothetical protein